MKAEINTLRQLWPALLLSTAVVVGVGLLGGWQAKEGAGANAGSSINKRKNFLFRDDYGYQDLETA